MLVDEAKIIVKAGHGGPGRVSFFPGAKSGPDGGDGGRGGDVYLKATTDLMALRPFTIKKTLAAKNGDPGGRTQMDGHDGDDITILVPVGTSVTDIKTDKAYEFIDPEQILLIAKGGLGGRGNYTLRSSRNTTPLEAQPGLAGEEKELEIKLKLIADFGLIGLPNAGKSSLLNELTEANPKIADYPFTTLEPNLGVFNLHVIADIPGLIEGASSGKGLGIKFLKHIEKTKMLLHCVSAENEDVSAVYDTVRKELEQYNPELLNKDEVILLTKTDLVTKEEERIKINELKKNHKSSFINRPSVIPISIHDWDSLEALKKLLSA